MGPISPSFLPFSTSQKSRAKDNKDDEGSPQQASLATLGNAAPNSHQGQAACKQEEEQQEQQKQQERLSQSAGQQGAPGQGKGNGVARRSSQHSDDSARDGFTTSTNTNNENRSSSSNGANNGSFTNGPLRGAQSQQVPSRPQSPLAAPQPPRSRQSSGSGPTLLRPSVTPAPSTSAPLQRRSSPGSSLGLFGLLPRAPSLQHPYHAHSVHPPPTSRAATRRAVPRATAPHHASSAATSPSPGAFIRYFLAPLVLLPIGWPWLVLRSCQLGLTAACLAAAAAVDALVLLADLLRRHRPAAEVLVAWAGGWLAWFVARYWAGLAQLHMTCEDALARVLRFLGPLAAAALRRSPAAARVASWLRPVVNAAAGAQAAVVGAYCFLHDEIVPVALDLAERLPLVHGLLHRAVVGGAPM